MDLANRLSKIYEFLYDVVELQEEEIKDIKNAVNIVHEMSPTDGPGIFSKTERVISASDDLEWSIMKIRNSKSDLRKKINSIKDVDFTMLVRQGRPSTAAIESEIRMNHPELSDMEYNIDIMNNIISYLEYLRSNLVEYIWLLKSKSSYLK